MAILVPTAASAEGIALRSRTGVGVERLELWTRHDAVALTPGAATAGQDGAGAYTETPYAGREATLTVRTYDRTRCSVVFVDSREDGVELRMTLPTFGRGMALHRIAPSRTAPQFVADYRLLGGENLELLWQQAGSKKGDCPYFLLAALGGAIGVGDYHFRVAAHRGHAPLLVCGSGEDPYRLSRELWTAAFAAMQPYGKLRWEKPYPDVFRWLGLQINGDRGECSTNIEGGSTAWRAGERPGDARDGRSYGDER